MPRKRSKKPKDKRTPKKEKSKKVSKPVQEDFPLKEYGLGLLEGFMKADTDVIAVAYRVPTGHIANDDAIRKYRSEAIATLQRVAKSRSYTLSVQHIHFKALPLGEETIIKAFGSLRDSMEYKRETRTEASRDGLFEEIKV